MRVEYYSNNSGGGEWLDRNDWLKLEAGGWEVNGRYATKDFDSIEEAIRDWEAILFKDADEPGCACCGQPHYFSVY